MFFFVVFFLFFFVFCFTYRPNWIGAYGEKYYRREYVHVGFQEDDLPGFGKILDVLLVSNIVLLQLELCQTLGINCHYQPIPYVIHHKNDWSYFQNYRTNRDIMLIHVGETVTLTL